MDPDPSKLCGMLRLNQVGNTSSRKNTEVQQLWPRLSLGWVTIQGLEVDAVATNIVKSQKRRKGTSITCIWGFRFRDLPFPLLVPVRYLPLSTIGLMLSPLCWFGSISPPAAGPARCWRSWCQNRQFYSYLTPMTPARRTQYPPLYSGGTSSSLVGLQQTCHRMKGKKF